MRLKHFLQGFAIVAIILTIIPFIAINYWWIRMFDFPHLQLTGLTLLALLAYFFRFEIKFYGDYLFVFALGACFIYQLLKIWPYTPFAPYEVMGIENTSAGEPIKIFTSNVYQDNQEWSKVADQIEKYDSDILLLTETNKWWVNKLTSATESKYKYKVSVPLENTYGMLMLSKIPLLDTRVRYLVDDSIPSIKTKLKLPSGDLIQVFAIHPTPPMPQENPTSTDRDAELMKIALDTRQSELPVVVMGDFNDVAWSESTQLFQRISGLLDMRKGRGLFNTYKAGNFLLKWPLDHIFISPDFRYKDMKLGANVDSDHLPFYAAIQLYPKGKSEQTIEGPSESQLKKAREEVEKARIENIKEEQ